MCNEFCRRYNVPCTKYEVQSRQRAEKQETRLIALYYEIRMVYEFSLLQHSALDVRYSTLKKDPVFRKSYFALHTWYFFCPFSQNELYHEGI
jgi:hypothetical protein